MSSMLFSARSNHRFSLTPTLNPLLCAPPVSGDLTMVEMNDALMLEFELSGTTNRADQRCATGPRDLYPSFRRTDSSTSNRLCQPTGSIVDRRHLCWRRRRRYREPRL